MRFDRVSSLAYWVMCLQIMKSDEDVRMISAEAPVLFAKVNATTSVQC